MNKFDKLQLALILQDIESLFTGDFSKNIASTAGSLMNNIDRDGFDKYDIAKLMLDQSFDQNQQGVLQKIQNNLALYGDKLAETLKKEGDEQGLLNLQSGNLRNIYDTISKVVFRKRKHKEGSIIEDDEDDIVIVRIGNKTYNCLIAESEEEKEIGLSNVEEMNKNEGMLFIYDQPQHLDFWMKDCDLELSIIFLDENKVVLSNQRGVPNTEDYISQYNAQYVLEVNYTEDVQPGDKAVFNLGEELEMEPDKLYILAEDGTIQHQLDAGCRIFSRANSQTLIRMAKRADESKLDKDYKALGRKVFEYLEIQDSREPEYVTE